VLRIRIGPDLLACYVISHTCTGTVKISVADPDLMGSHKHRIKLMDFIFLSVVYSILRSEGFSCSLDVIYGGLGINKLQFYFSLQKMTDPDSGCSKTYGTDPDPQHCSYQLSAFKVTRSLFFCV
jgi:hypothetical protein